MLTKDILKPEQVKKRNRKNAITFLGQFYSFVAETIISVTCLYTYKTNAYINARLAWALGAWIEFGLVSFIEVMTSSNLQDYLPHKHFS